MEFEDWPNNSNRASFFEIGGQILCPFCLLGVWAISEVPYTTLEKTPENSLGDI